MSTHIINGFITYEKSPYREEPEINFYTFRPSHEHWPNMVVVREHSIEVEVPDDFDPRPNLIAGLEEKQRKAAADFEKLRTEIQRQISELSAITMEQGATA